MKQLATKNPSSSYKNSNLGQCITKGEIELF